VRILNRTRGTVIGSHVEVADGLWSRVRGYLGRPEPDEGEGILLTPCNAVHMFGMKYPLDVLFLDSRGTVIEVAERLAPWRRTRRVRGARYALEVRAGTVEATGTEPGDGLAWTPPRSSLPYSGPLAKDHVDRQHAAAASTPPRS